VKQTSLVLSSLAVACLSCGCGSGTGGQEGDAGYAPSALMGSCAAVLQQHPIEGQAHVNVCSVVDYGTDPPSSGNHYGIWAAYKIYPAPIPEGFWVHDLEHGAVVLTYNCASGRGDQASCDADVAAATAMLSSLPDDPACDALGQGVKRRNVMTPDPALDVRFAASAWGWTLKANCFDAAVFEAFEKAHYGQAPEDLCQDGEDPLSMGLPASCGVE
jgi:hypothetical protein